MKAGSLTFVPGWGSNCQVWAPLIAAFRTKRPIHLIELPGHGDTPFATSATLVDWSDTLAGRLEAQTVLCGWSLGAMLALQLASRHPQLVKALVLVAPTPRFVSGTGWQHGLEPETVDRFRSGFRDDPEAILRRFTALQALGDDHRRTVVRHLEASRAAQTPESRRALGDGLRVLAESDLRATLGGLDLPTRVLHGENDVLMPVAAARWLAQQLPNARLSILKDCGHAPHLARPLECAALIESFVDD